MSDPIKIERWARPWAPADDAELVETLDYQDMPLAGIVRQGDASYLFTCLAGELLSSHVWAYRPLTSTDRDRLAAADSPEGLSRIADEILSGGPLVIAVATDDDGILGSTEVDSSSDVELAGAVDRISEELGTYLNDRRHRAEELRRLVAKATA